MKREQLCGQCGKEYTDRCRTRMGCTLHRGACFQCLDCEKQPPAKQLSPCAICKRLCEPSESYFEYRCGKYLCREQFLRMDLRSAQVLLACGHSQMIEQVVSFMSGFCFHCGRRLRDFDCNQLNFCALCERQESGESPQQIESQQQKKESASVELIQQKSEAVRRDLQCVIEVLSRDLQQCKQRLLVSEFTRKQIREMVWREGRDRQCLVCLQVFDVSVRRPMMVCLQQHLLCEGCLGEEAMRECPLCRERIEKERVVVCRERMHTLEMERVFAQKYGQKLEVFRGSVQKNGRGAVQIPTVVHRQTQTEGEGVGQQSVESLGEAGQGKRQLKRPLGQKIQVQKAKAGRKRRKQ